MYKKELAKSKTATKTMVYNPNKLKSYVLDTLHDASSLVGSTLGPNGKIVLIERQENLPPFATKDGITVFNSMAFADSTKQAILEAARDSSSKTNTDAGDGTTTATILAESLIRRGFNFLSSNPKMSAQKVMRDLERAYDEIVAPFINDTAIKIKNAKTDDEEKENSDLLRKVALVATNYDETMSNSVIECFDMLGHGANITIAETPGISGYEVEKVEGFHIPRGFEDSCGRFIEEFINDRSAYKTNLIKPKFVLYNGQINDMQVLMPIFEKISNAANPSKGKDAFSANIVVVAHHFSESVLATLAGNFKQLNTINVIPLKTPLSFQANSQYHFLLDLSSFVGAKVFDPLTTPLPTAQLQDIGLDSIEFFEFNRYKSTVMGRPEELFLLPRAAELEHQMSQAESSLDKELLNERLATLTGGIARIKVFGSSESELKEKKHRVEDAIASVKGAIKYGVLPGCAKTLLTLSYILSKSDAPRSVKEIMGKAFQEPFYRILSNGGNHKDEILEVKNGIMFSEDESLRPFFDTYDAMNFKFGNAIELGILDSAAAVNMAIKNSLSVSKMLMCLSGTVVFQRDNELDVMEAKDTMAEQRAMQEALADSNNSNWEPEY